MTDTRIFESAPAGLPLMLKAALPAIPIVGGLPGIKHETSGLPTTVLKRTRVATDLAHLDRYNEVCGFARADTLPATYPHIAAHTLHLTMMTDTSFPFPPLGAVHLRNRITQYRPIGREEIYELSLRTESNEPHPKGRLINLVSEAHIGGELVWDESMTVLFRSRNGGDEPTPAPLAGVEPPAGDVHWNLGDDLGRRYGARHSVSRVRSPTACGPRRTASRQFQTSCRTRSPLMSSSRSRFCFPALSSSAAPLRARRPPSVFKMPTPRHRTSSDAFRPSDVQRSFGARVGRISPS